MTDIEGLNRADRAVVAWMSAHGVASLRIGLGLVFVWFGALKFFPGLSPAEDLVRNTIYFVPPSLFQPVLAGWEVLIGVGLLLGRWMRLTLALLFAQMAGTALPLVLLPDVCWQVFPFVLTLEGQIHHQKSRSYRSGIGLGRASAREDSERVSATPTSEGRVPQLNDLPQPQVLSALGF